MVDPKSSHQSTLRKHFSPLVLKRADGVNPEDVNKYLRGRIEAVNETNDEPHEVIDEDSENL